jgi:hypothetical protein
VFIPRTRTSIPRGGVRSSVDQLKTYSKPSLASHKADGRDGLQRVQTRTSVVQFPK